jgi:hypothetical protein
MASSTLDETPLARKERASDRCSWLRPPQTVSTVIRGFTIFVASSHWHDDEHWGIGVARRDDSSSVLDACAEGRIAGRVVIVVSNKRIVRMNAAFRSSVDGRPVIRARFPL